MNIKNQLNRTAQDRIDRPIATNPLAFLALVIALFTTPLAIAQDPGGDLPFSSGSDGSDGALVMPENLPPLQGHAAAFDAARGETVLFGGLNPQTNTYTNDTWVFDGFEWIVKNPATKPSIRGYHEMVYDADNGVIVMFGGYNLTTNHLAETWLWDGTDWALQSPSESPSARYQFGMAYDTVNNQTVLYGGISDADSHNEDTWTWDGTNWTLEAPVDNAGGRRYHSIAFDQANGETVLYGGYKDGSWSAETWTWNGTNWTLESPVANPGNRIELGLAYDEAGSRIIFFGGEYSGRRNDTWSWDGTNWTQLTTNNLPEIRDYPELVYDANQSAMLLINGRMQSSSSRSDTFELVSDDWASLTGDIIYYDMSGRSNGTWHYTTIDIPEHVEVRFIKNDENTPVYWLATGNININGTLNLNGENADNSTDPGSESAGGPGGFDGGLGGTRFDVSSSYAGAPGQGPGGGDPGVTASEYGSAGGFNGVYGNASLNPNIGGSGGGGGASSATVNGGEGGGGGGAFLAASSRDINLNGSITAKGGTRAWSGISYGGWGSGGAVRLVGDRVTGTGSITARSGNNSSVSPDTGYVRIEAFYRTFIDDSSSILPIATAGPPSNDPGSILPENQPMLTVTTVAGDAVPEPPAGSSADPDVIFQETGPITIIVTSENIPNGTPVTLRITTSGEVINLPGPGNPIVTLSGGSATFTVIVPAGLGNIQAFAEFTP